MREELKSKFNNVRELRIEEYTCSHNVLHLHVASNHTSMSIERSLSHTHVHIDGLHSSIVEYQSTSSMQVIRAPTVNGSKKNDDIDTTKVV